MKPVDKPSMIAASARVLAVALTGLAAAGGVAGCTASDVPGDGQATPSGTGAAGGIGHVKLRLRRQTDHWRVY
ncbi:MAG: hypothetical protein LBE08_11450 [Bifidobacteriaceae bacterium]|jgi:hypothetical protein|nr:hypothetical protein [Bifidobacteriaceae bacterium]